MNSLKKYTPAHLTKISAGSGQLVKKTCKIHGGYLAKKIDFGGRDLTTGCPQCIAEYENTVSGKCSNPHADLEKSRIPKRFISSTIAGYDTGNHGGKTRAAKLSQAYVDTFPERKMLGESLVFCGVPGTGKTHLACAVAIELIQRGHKALYSTTYDAVMSVKSTYGIHSDKTEKEVLDVYRNVELLIIDEVGVQFGTDTERIIFYQIINGRYENVLPTILISNLPEPDLEKYIGGRCLDRLREGAGAVVAFDWESYRRHGNKNTGRPF